MGMGPCHAVVVTFSSPWKDIAGSTASLTDFPLPLPVSSIRLYVASWREYAKVPRVFLGFSLAIEHLIRKPRFQHTTGFSSSPLAVRPL
jgi:hypothetical protein